MSTTFFEDALYALDKYRTTFIHQQNARMGKSAHMASGVCSLVNDDISYPCVTRVDFPLDSCQLEGGEGDTAKFSLYRPNVFTLRTPCPFVNVDDWSACILHDMGEVISIEPSSLGIQITYIVKLAFPIPDTIHVAIQYRGVSIFPVPVEIEQTIFENSSRLAFRSALSDIDADNNSLYVQDVWLNGSFIALHDEKNWNTRIYEIADRKTELGDVACRLVSISKINYSSKKRFTGTRTIIGYTDANQLAEFSFDDVILRIFPFVNTYYFDICQVSDYMIVSFRDRMDIALVKLSTGETLCTIPLGKACHVVYLSPSGQSISAWTFNCVQIYSAMTGALIKKMQFKKGEYMSQFLSDQTILVYNHISRVTSVANFLTGETFELLPGVDWGKEIPFVQGPYAWCFVDGNLCAYE